MGFENIKSEEQVTRELQENINRYQEDRENNQELRSRLFEEVKSRALFLGGEEFSKIAKEELGEQDGIPMNEYLGCADGTTLRPIINKDAVSEELLPYILSHETTEVLEMFPNVNERSKWREEHSGQRHPQEAVGSDEEAIYAEYRHAKKDRMLEKQHTFMIGMADKYQEYAKASGNEKTVEAIEERKKIRNQIFKELSETD